MSTQSVFHSGRIFGGGGGGDDSNFSSCMLVDGAIISHIGHESDQVVQSAIAAGARQIDLEARLVVP